MSVTMTKAYGSKVITLTSDPNSFCPPLCQILCCSPECCSVSQHLRRLQRSSQSVLGALHITVGLLNIGLGVILCVSRSSPYWEGECTSFPFWLGGVYLLLGTIGILSERYPSPCLVIANVILNLLGVLCAIAAIVLYSINLAITRLWGMCDHDYYDDYISYGQTTTLSPGDKIMKEKCLEGKELFLMVMRSVSGVLIVLSVLEFCLTISSAVMGIKALRRNARGENMKIDDPEHYKPLAKEVTSKPTV